MIFGHSHFSNTTSSGYSITSTATGVGDSVYFSGSYWMIINSNVYNHYPAIWAQTAKRVPANWRWFDCFRTYQRIERKKQKERIVFPIYRVQERYTIATRRYDKRRKFIQELMRV